MKTRLTAITDEGVEAVRTAEDGAEEPVKIACDYVVMAVGSKANAFDLDGVTVPVTCWATARVSAPPTLRAPFARRITRPTSCS